jgi:hypothetical protein
MPGTTAITFGNTELSANLMHQVTALNRMKDHPYPLVDDVMDTAETVDGSERVIVRWVTDDHSRATRVTTGFEVFDDFAQTTLTPGFQTWGIVVQPVFISSVDEQKNNGKAAVLKLLEERVKTVETHFKRQFQQVLLRGPAASGTWPGVPGWEDFLTLNGADGSTTGLIEAAASGTNTLHNLNKGLFPATTHEQFHNFFRDLGGTFSTTGLNGLYASIVDAQIKEGDPNGKESKWYWSRLFCELAKRSIRTLEQYVSNSGNEDDGSRVAHMVYGGIPVRPTVELPSSGSGSTSNPWSALKVNWAQGINFKVMNGWKMEYDDFVDLPGTVGARYALKKLWGQLIGLVPGRCALLVDGEVF